MVQASTDIREYASFVYDYIQQYVQLDRNSFERFIPYLEVRKFGKREQVLKYGQVDEYLNLVVKGLVRKYLLMGKVEKTIQLAIEGKLVQSEISFHQRLPSTIIIEALEPTTLVSIRYENVQLLLDEVPEAEEIGRQMMIYLFIKKEKRYFAQLNNTTRQRFLHYINQHPQMLQRVPQKILASYLEIKPETFSRLKHLLK